MNGSWGIWVTWWGSFLHIGFWRDIPLMLTHYIMLYKNVIPSFLLTLWCENTWNSPILHRLICSRSHVERRWSSPLRWSTWRKHSSICCSHGVISCFTYFTWFYFQVCGKKSRCMDALNRCYCFSAFTWCRVCELGTNYKHAWLNIV